MVTPVAIDTVHTWYALSVAVLAVNVSVAGSPPLPVAVVLVVKAVVPHPSVVGVAKGLLN